MSTDIARMRPTILQPKPSLEMSLIGGAVGAVFLSSILYAAPVFGFPILDFPRVIGGIVFRSTTGALALGYVLFLLLGIVFAIPLNVVWLRLPGHPILFRGALVKGILYSLPLWALSGLLIAVLGWLNRVPSAELQLPGLFGWRLGWSGPLLLLLSHLGYGVAAAILMAMPQGIMHPIDLMGWYTHAHGDMRDVSVHWEKKPTI